MVFKDPLLDIYNRRYAEIFIESLINDFHHFDIPFGVIFLDIDDFKSFNDNYGHEIGDEILKNVSKTLKENIRLNDLLARWGGDEFVLALRGVNKEQLDSISEKLLAIVRTTTVKYKGKELSITMSSGSTMFRKTDTLESVINRADELMYRSKRSGKNMNTTDS